MARVLTNFADGALSADITAVATSATSSGFTRLPTIIAGSGDYALLTFGTDQDAPEIVKITEHAASSTTVTIGTRAQLGTAAAAWASGTNWADAALDFDFEQLTIKNKTTGAVSDGDFSITPSNGAVALDPYGFHVRRSGSWKRDLNAQSVVYADLDITDTAGTTNRSTIRDAFYEAWALGQETDQETVVSLRGSTLGVYRVAVPTVGTDVVDSRIVNTIQGTSGRTWGNAGKYAVVGIPGVHLHVPHGINIRPPVGYKPDTLNRTNALIGCLTNGNDSNGTAFPRTGRFFVFGAGSIDCDAAHLDPTGTAGRRAFNGIDIRKIEEAAVFSFGGVLEVVDGFGYNNAADEGFSVNFNDVDRCLVQGIKSYRRVLTGVVATESTDTFTYVGHGLANGAAVHLLSIAGFTGFSAGTSGTPKLYYVINRTADTFQLSATSGGGAVAIGTADGTCTVGGSASTGLSATGSGVVRFFDNDCRNFGTASASGRGITVYDCTTTVYRGNVSTGNVGQGAGIEHFDSAFVSDNQFTGATDTASENGVGLSLKANVDGIYSAGHAVIAGNTFADNAATGISHQLCTVLSATTGTTSPSGIAAVAAAAATDTFTSAAHGLADGDIVWMSAIVTFTGFSTNTNYYVRDSATNTFKLAATAGGTALDIGTADGTCTITKRPVVVLTSGGAATQVGRYCRVGANGPIAQIIGVSSNTLQLDTAHGGASGDSVYIFGEPVQVVNNKLSGNASEGLNGAASAAANLGAQWGVLELRDNVWGGGTRDISGSNAAAVAAAHNGEGPWINKFGAALTAPTFVDTELCYNPTGADCILYIDGTATTWGGGSYVKMRGAHPQPPSTSETLLDPTIFTPTATVMAVHVPARAGVRLHWTAGTTPTGLWVRV